MHYVMEEFFNNQSSNLIIYMMRKVLNYDS